MSNPFRNHAAKDLEIAISKALSDLTGVKVKTSIGSLSFKDGMGTNPGVTLQLISEEDIDWEARHKALFGQSAS